MIAAAGAVLLARPVPKIEYANNTPSPGPGFASSRNRIDLPVSVAWLTPSGVSTPWLMALFRNSTFAGSMMMLANGNRLCAINQSIPLPNAFEIPSTAGPNAKYPTTASAAPAMPAEKLFTFSAGIAGAALAVVGYFAFGPAVEGISKALGSGIDWLIAHSLLPFASIIIEPAKVLFLNNAINHGVLTPLGVNQATETGKSILFLLEANPGPGLGVLLAYSIFGTGLAKSTAPAAAIIQF